MDETTKLKNWIEKIVKYKIQSDIFTELSESDIINQLLLRLKSQNTIQMQNNSQKFNPKSTADRMSIDGLNVENFKQQKKISNKFTRMENATKLIEFARTLGMPEEELAASCDIVENKNHKQTLIFFYSFSRHLAQKHIIKQDLVLGPTKISKPKSLKVWPENNEIPFCSTGSVSTGLDIESGFRGRDITTDYAKNIHEKKGTKK